MNDFFRRTFGKAGALAYLGEAGAHVWVLTHKGFELASLKLWADWYFFILGGYATAGLFTYATQVKWRGCRWCVVYWFTTLWTLGTVLLHAYIIFFAPGDELQKHKMLQIFPPAYSWIGLAYSLFFVWYLGTLELLRSEE
jgi:hypothetical protein